MNLPGELSQRGFVRIGGCAEGKLRSKFLRYPALFPNGGLIVETIAIASNTETLPQFLRGRDVHSDKESAAPFLLAVPAVGIRCQFTPAAQVEVTDAEVCPLRKRERIPQGRQQILIDVVEDSGHGVVDSTQAGIVAETRRFRKTKSTGPRCPRRTGSPALFRAARLRQSVRILQIYATSSTTRISRST